MSTPAAFSAQPSLHLLQAYFLNAAAVTIAVPYAQRAALQQPSVWNNSQ
jgi:hypothetical protein